MLSMKSHITLQLHVAPSTVGYGIIKQFTNGWRISIYVTTSQGTANMEMSDISYIVSTS